MIVITAGTFDLLHYGHINLLRHCRKMVGKKKINKNEVIVFLNPDGFIKQFKGKNPIMTYEERKQALLGCKYVDKILENTGWQDFKKTIDEMLGNVDYIVIGSDWHEKDYLKQMSFDWDWLRKKDIGICYIPYTQNISTTEIKRRLS